MRVLSVLARALGLVGLLGALVLTGAPTDAAVHPGSKPTGGSGTSYITRSGATLLYRGARFQFVGVNAYGLAARDANTPAAPGCDGLTYTDAELDALFQALPANGVVRFWATRASTVADVGKVIAAAQRNGRFVIPSFVDGSNYCNRTGQTIDAAWYASTYRTDGFQQWVTSLASTYKDNPAVAMWEIASEPGWGPNGDLGVTRDQLHDFLSTVAGWTKAADPHHLVESGVMTSVHAIEAPGASLAQMRANFAYVQNSPSLDVTSIHDYEYDYSGNTGQAGLFPISYLPAARDDLKKPIIVGEYGAQVATGTLATCRDSSYSLTSLVTDKQRAYLGAGAAGALLWNWMKERPAWLTGDGCSGSTNENAFGSSSPVLAAIRASAATLTPSAALARARAKHARHAKHMRHVKHVRHARQAKRLKHRVRHHAAGVGRRR